MSDLDLDAIRRRLSHLDAAGFRIDGTNSVIVKMATLVGTDVPALLAEVERLNAVIAGGNEMLTNANAQIRTLQANQLPDGGEWRVVYGWYDSSGGAFWCELENCEGPVNHDIRRRIWHGPAQPLSDVLATPDPDSATQTTPITEESA